MTTARGRHRRAGLHDRLRQPVRDRGAARRAADRPQLAAALRLRPLCRAVSRVRPSPRRARTNERSWLYRIRPTVAHWGAFQKTDAGLWRTAPCAEVRDADPAAALGPDPDAGEGLSFVAGHPHHHHRRRCGDAVRHGGARLSRSRARCRTSTSTTPTPRCCSCRSRARCGSATEFGIIDIAPGRDRRHPARREVPRRAAGRPGARLPVRELRRRVHPAGARPDRRQLPGQSARLPDPGRGL